MLEYVSNLYLPGAVATWCALVFALISLWGYSQVIRGDRTAVAFARRAYRFFALSVVLASVVLAVLLIRRDFRIEYVYQYSGLDLQSHFQFAAFWAGQKGSFLIWLFWGAVLGLPLIKTAGKKQEAPVMMIYTMTVLGLLFILVRENPFVMLAETPPDGRGLNPLLQDDWMVIHPPIMFVGYALSAVPFAFAVSALWRKEYDGWARRAFPWALAGFLVLGCAILMGGYWAYKTLGWGGYWGWDPVENASLIPWLFGVVLIHGLHMERVKGRYRRMNLVIACLMFLSVLYGTFLTRSGVLADFSVHSFVDLGISGWLIGLMVVFFVMSAGLLALRWRSIPTRPNEDPHLLSRGAFMVVASIVVLLSAVLVTFGTSAPLITRWYMETPAQVGPEWYNRMNFPLAVLAALLLSLVPFVTWRGAETKELLRKLVPAAGVGLVATLVAVYLGVTEPFHALLVFLAALALTSNFQKALARAKVGAASARGQEKHLRSSSEEPEDESFASRLASAYRSTSAGLRSAGGYLSHVGVGVILLGFLASSAYDQSAKVTLTQNEPQQVGDMEMTFTRFIPRIGHEKERMEIRVVRADGSEYWSYPKLFVNERTKQVMAHPHIRTTPIQDIYVSPIDYDPGAPAGAPQSFELAKGESHTLGDGVTVRFRGFNLDVQGNAMAAMDSGQPVTVGAVLEITQNGGTSTVVPLYTIFTQAQRAQALPVEVPGGGFVRIGAINAGEGEVKLDVAGVGSAAEPIPPKLSVDVTRKPLIQLVWFGLYIILFGGLLAMWQRFREAKIWERARPDSA